MPMRAIFLSGHGRIVIHGKHGACGVFTALSVGVEFRKLLHDPMGADPENSVLVRMTASAWDDSKESSELSELFMK